MTSVSILRLPAHSYLHDAIVVQVHCGVAKSTDDSVLDALVAETIRDSKPIVENTPDRIPSVASAVTTIPIFFGHDVTSVVVLIGSKQRSEDDSQEPIGVMEVWEPAGPFDELALTKGSYGPMERFQNVSSFVRFECGTGLPGQVWEKGIGVIHDDLANHPGFLRAAGASSDLLQTAIGIPVIHDEFIASVLLISCQKSPIARGFEVWHRCEDGFEMLGGSYVEFDRSFALEPESRMPAVESWAKLLGENHSAVLSDDPTVLQFNRDCGEDAIVPQSGIAIPRFDGSELDSFVTLLF